MSDSGYALFDSPIGVCGIAWRPEGLAGVQLPSNGPSAALALLRRRFPMLVQATPPPWVEAAIESICAALSGEARDLASIELDFTGVGAFDAAVYRTAREIPVGATLTYGELAQSLGNSGQARAVGQALGRNPWPIVVPCHRVTAAAGRAGGFSAPGGRATKLRLLELEGALAAESLPLFAERSR